MSGCYNFFHTNCHSFAAGALNAAIDAAPPHAPLAHAKPAPHGAALADGATAHGRSWSVFEIGTRLFLFGEYTGMSGFVRTWGGHISLWFVVLTGSALEGSLNLTLGFVQLLFASNG